MCKVHQKNCAKHIKVSCAGGNVNTININKRKVKNGKQKKETEEATEWKKRTKFFLLL